MEEIDKENLPQHIAIIMDGNRRWAKREGKDTPSGHKEGAENLKRISRYANSIGIKYMTVYAFSTENWKRSKAEVAAIMKILQFYLSDFLSKADKDNIKINIIGDIESIDKGLKSEIIKSTTKTQNNTGMVLNIAFNYGGRDEIVRATQNIVKLALSEKVKIEDINEELISNNLYTKNQPDPDLVIRTSGEERISNFLLWQIAYSELVFVKKYWPEFGKEDLDEAIREYQHRTRKFGGK